MKIEKLITLSEFVCAQHTGTGLHSRLAKMYIDCYKYNSFLKQPLTKYMFVNPYPKPIEDDYKVTELGEELACYQFSKDFDRWQEAEKKVMFEGVACVEEESIGLCKVYLNYIKIAHYWKRDDTWLCLYKTLHDLAEATEGELKIKNIEI